MPYLQEYLRLLKNKIKKLCSSSSTKSDTDEYSFNDLFRVWNFHFVYDRLAITTFFDCK